MATITLPESEVQERKKTTTKYVYFFGGGKADGHGKMKEDLGGKGAGLAEMTNASGLYDSDRGLPRIYAERLRFQGSRPADGGGAG
jgi:hypothetical protein